MKRVAFQIIFALFPIMILNLDVYATKYPNIAFQVSGKIVDWDTKEPLENVYLIIFLNDAIYADNHGWVKNAHDYPNFPKSDKEGLFNGRTRLYRSSSKIRIKKVEIIAFRDGYRTERFIFKNIKFSLSSDKLSGTMKVKTIELLKNRTE